MVELPEELLDQSSSFAPTVFQSFNILLVISAIWVLVL
jgi:hypothetical protein